MRGLRIIHEDKDLLVVCKEPGLLTMSYHRDQNATVERLLTSYLRKGSDRTWLNAFTVHRLDRDTSGLLVFAKSGAAQQKLKAGWKNVEKRYTAVVHGQLAEQSGKFSSYLVEDDHQFVRSTTDAERGKLAETLYRVVKETARYSLLDLTLVTGRKNQIRAHLAEAGHPVVGDKKYGRKGDRTTRLALHARSLAFPHPHDGKPMAFEAPVPEAILRLVGEGPARQPR
jgi:tRNA pseudouridine32 synthase/23S rRNA pseudouridine746 synthase/23S rRNA pseudouridine1911/1915/1917 synthase